jgi:hypothetical protein
MIEYKQKRLNYFDTAGNPAATGEDEFQTIKSGDTGLLDSNIRNGHK